MAKHRLLSKVIWLRCGAFQHSVFIHAGDMPQGVTAWSFRYALWQYLQADCDVGQASCKVSHVAALTQLSLMGLNGRTSSMCSSFPLICCKAYMSPWLNALQTIKHTAIHKSRVLQHQLKMLANGVSHGLSLTLASCSQKQDASCRQLCCAPV